MTIVISIILAVIMILVCYKAYTEKISELEDRHKSDIKVLKNSHENQIKELKREEKRSNIIIPIPIDFIDEFFEAFDLAAGKDALPSGSFKLWKLLIKKFPEVENDDYEWKIKFSPVTKPCIIGEPIPEWQKSQKKNKEE